MKARIILVAMTLAGLAAVLATQAQEVPGRTATVDVNKLKDDLRLRELILANQFSEFEISLLKLKDRLKRSGKTEDKLRAEILEKVLEQSKDASISVQFEQMVEMLKNSRLAGIGDLKILDERSHKLADDLRDILAKMLEDPKHSRLRDERLSLERLVKEIEKIIHDQKVVQGQTDRNKTDPKELKSNQGQVTKATDKVAKEIAKSNKSDKGAEAKNSKGEAKEGGKEGKKGESKDAGKGPETKKGETKEAGPKTGSKEGDKKGEAKAGEKSDADSKKGEAKAGAKGEPKEADSAKGDEKSKSDAKKGEPKEPGAKPSKNAEAKSGDAKPGDAKSGPKDSKQGEAKPGQKSDGKGEAKKGEAKSGEKGDPQKAGEKGEPPQAQQPKDNIASGRKQVEDAEYKMKQAEEKIANKKNKDASEDQGKAIQDLEKAKKKLEDLLRQIREEELERLLAALQARCEKMLAMQIQVQTGTDGVFRLAEATADKKPSRQNQQDSLKLSDSEKDIVTEANKAIEMLEAEGSAVAFPEVFQQVRQDMMHVQRRLEVTDVGVVTQAIEKDIIDTLKEMIEALKKARQDMDKEKAPPPPPGSAPPPGQRDQKLLDQIAELKMIRSMQIRVNSRTETYGKMYVPKEGEQTADPTIRRELSNLSERQERIFDVANRIAKGDNK